MLDGMDAFLLPQVVAYCFDPTREDIHGEHCKNCWLGFGEEFVSRFLCGRGGELCAVEDVEAQPGSAFLRGAGRGDPLLRGLLYEGAFALLSRRLRDGGGNFPKTVRFVAEKSLRVAAVAWANRNARSAWSMIRHGTEYEEKSKEKPVER